ncbi:hypothetical protein [Mesorhizobium sp. IMUNJ 23232]|uniref:hypothetical protein n=1 Tax=Mesorhizobium sp. IMUNJ 23232 TaxID=3376064 RepID=UPI0037AD21B0
MKDDSQGDLSAIYRHPGMSHIALMVAKPPKRPNTYPDRHIDCQEALEIELQGFIERAQRAGWSLDDIERATRTLLWAQRRALEETAKLEADLAIMRAMARAAR